MDDAGSNPTLEYEKGSAKLNPVQKSDYWRQKVRLAKSQPQKEGENIYKPIMEEYLLDLLTKQERGTSRGMMMQDRGDKMRDIAQKQGKDLMKSVSDFGASFANRRYIDPNSPIPESGYNPENDKAYVDEYRQGIIGGREQADKYKGMNAKVLQYLAEKRDAEIKAKEEAKMKLELAKIRGENDPMKALMYGLKQSEENRQRGEYEMKKEKFESDMAEKEKKASQEDELTARYKNQMRNLDKLTKIVNDMSAYQASGIVEGIANLFKDDPTSFSSEIDKTIYDLALDYAKIVDPTSVAREGEVAAAEKYALPIKRYILTGQKGAALRLIEKHREDVESRVRSSSKTDYLPEIDYVIIQAPDGSKAKIRKNQEETIKKYISKGGKIVQ